MIENADHKLGEDLKNAFYEMENYSCNFFITGNAGTGKTTLLNYYKKNTKKKCIVLAPTGIAAIQIGGSTIHSFFGFPFRTLLKNDPEIKRWGKAHPKFKIINEIDTIIIDEVSMVKADLLDGIDQALRLNLNSDLPFGGKQLLLFGDVFQLPPVTTNHEWQQMPDEYYESPYFFSARIFNQAEINFIILKKILRQSDEDFIQLLNLIRVGEAGTKEIDYLNNNCARQVLKDENYRICLCTVNATADKINVEKLKNIKNNLFEYKGIIQGTFPEKNLPVETFLKLKVGAQVMMTKNDLLGRWVNGSIGEIHSLTHAQIKVELPGNKIFNVDPAIWENKTYKWDEETQTVKSETTGTYTQYPLRLAWAITIHKSQGLTFDHVSIDLGRGAFAHGQLYVALSRCRTLEGIQMRSMINNKDIIIDNAVIEFADRYLRKRIGVRKFNQLQ